MKVVVAPDAFKGSLTAVEAAAALAEGLRAALPDAEVLEVPVADGGEGTVATLVAATGGTLERATVTGPLGEPVEAEWGVLGDGVTAVIEMAQASGLTLVPPERRDPTRTTTRGTGELIRLAVERGCQRVLVGLGGSATCDGGAGMAQALGARLLDARGNELGPGGGALLGLERIVGELPQVSVVAACDVDNPLTGPQGAAAVYGPQKGATPEQVALLERALARFAEVVRRDLRVEVETVPGAGAAGGLGAGLLAFLDASLQPGAALVLEAVGFEERIAGAELVVTGEGRLDAQTLHAKAPHGVLLMAQVAGVRAVAVGGQLDPTAADGLRAAGFTELYEASQGLPLEQAVAEAARLLREVGQRIGEELS